MTHRLARTLCTAVALLGLQAGASAATYQVGSGKPYTTLAGLPALAPGDVVEVGSGTYHEVKRWTASGTSGAPITIRGVGATRPVIDADGLDVSGSLPHPRAVFQVEGSWVVIENFELKNARNGDNGSGVRITGSGGTADHVTIRGCRIHDCDMGIMSGLCDRTLIESCEVDHNGTALYSGYSHNFYLGGGATTVTGCWIHDSLYGQNVKSRGHYTELLYNWIADSQDGEVGLVDEAETATPNSNALVVGNVLISKNRGSGWNSERFIMFGSDSGGAHSGTMYAFNNTCIAGTTSINFLWTNRAEASIVARGNVFVGSATISSGNTGSVSGSGNWMPNGTSVPAGFTASVLGAAPGFVVGAARDFHLVSGSSCIGIAPASPSYVDGGGAAHVGAPTLMYQAFGTLAARPSDAALDAGAYEFGSGTTTGGTTTGGTTTGGTTTSGSTTSGGTTTSGTTTTGTSTGGTTVSSSGTGGATGRTTCGIGGGAAALGLVALVGWRGRRQRRG
jgi:hypothetical protein